jgi:secreted trypsin-like serine protease
MLSKVAIRKLLILFILTTLLLSCSGDSSSRDGDESSPLPSQNACLSSNNSRSAISLKIVSGASCPQASSPIAKLELVAEEKSGVCSGVAIADDTVLSAAHCFMDASPNISLYLAGVSYPISSITIHPNFSLLNETTRNDLAIIKVSKKLRVAPLPILISTTPNNGELVSVHGFGLDEFAALGLLKAGWMRVHNVTSSFINTRYTDESSEPCFGDSGGPLLSSNLENPALPDRAILGILSFSSKTNCRVGDINSYANLQEEKNLKFIMDVAPHVTLR